MAGWDGKCHVSARRFLSQPPCSALGLRDVDGIGQMPADVGRAVPLDLSARELRLKK